MLRERKRPDYELIVFKYRIWPFEIPQELWAVAKEQQRIWNEMTECFTATMDASKELTDKDEKTALFTAYHQKIKDIYQASPIHCDARQAVYERFVETVKRYLKGLKNKGGEGLQNGKPRVKKGLDRINIPFNDRTGGKETDFLFGRCKRFSLKEKPFPETTVGKFLLGNQYMRFKAVIHRPLPKDAIFKRLSLVGEFTPSFGWDWYITFLLEVPPKSPAVRIDLPSTGRTAALDIGWRIFEEYIRIGVIADSDGNVFEVRLPMDRTNGKIASQIEWLTAKKGEKVANLFRLGVVLTDGWYGASLQGDLTRSIAEIEHYAKAVGAPENIWKTQLDAAKPTPNAPQLLQIAEDLEEYYQK